MVKICSAYVTEEFYPEIYAPFGVLLLFSFSFLLLLFALVLVKGYIKALVLSLFFLYTTFLDNVAFEIFYCFFR